MPTIVVDLQEGFRGERVQARIDGALAFAADDVRTNQLTGFAATFTAIAPARRISFSVELSDRDRTHQLAIDLASDPTYVGLQLDGAGELHHSARSTPFGYG